MTPYHRQNGIFLLVLLIKNRYLLLHSALTTSPGFYSKLIHGYFIKDDVTVILLLGVFFAVKPHGFGDQRVVNKV
jgi:hypothetical protein